MSDALDLFKESLMGGLRMFYQMLLVFDFFSVLCVGNEDKIAAHKAIQLINIYKSIATLDHCCSNFAKVAFPILFSHEQEGSKEPVSEFTLTMKSPICLLSLFSTF